MKYGRTIGLGLIVSTLLVVLLVSRTYHPGVGLDNEFACGIDPTTIPSDDDWLTTNGNQIVDSSGNPVWLTGVNWFGFNTNDRVLLDLKMVKLKSLLREIAERGISVLRIPISTQLMKEWMLGEFKKISVDIEKNPDLKNANSLEIFDYLLAQAKSCGIKVIVDAHSAEADDFGHNDPLWYKGEITTEDFHNTWKWFANRYKADDTIIAYDLENEPHGFPSEEISPNYVKTEAETWEEYCTRKPETKAVNFSKWDTSSDENNWKQVAEKAAQSVLAINPKVLVLIEGVEVYPKFGKWVDNKVTPGPAGVDQCYHFIWWGANLRPVKDLPIEVPEHAQQIVYSPHEYGPLVYMQPWFLKEFSRDTLRQEVWEPNWLYLYNEGISPLFIGEWGGFMDGGINQKWLEALRDEIAEKRLHHTFWVLNPNSGDTGGLLLGDWLSWDEEKYALLKPALWQQGGKFVGLDSKVPLGGNAGTGITRP